MKNLIISTLVTLAVQNLSAAVIKTVFRPEVNLHSVRFKLQTPPLVREDVFAEAVKADCLNFTEHYDKLNAENRLQYKKHIMELRQFPLEYTMKGAYDVELQALFKIDPSNALQNMQIKSIEVDLSKTASNSLLRKAKQHQIPVEKIELISEMQVRIVSRELICDLVQNKNLTFKIEMSFNPVPQLQTSDTEWLNAAARYVQEINQSGSNLLLKAARIGYGYRDLTDSLKKQGLHTDVSLNEFMQDILIVQDQSNDFRVPVSAEEQALLFKSQKRVILIKAELQLIKTDSREPLKAEPASVFQNFEERYARFNAEEIESELNKLRRKIKIAEANASRASEQDFRIYTQMQMQRSVLIKLQLKNLSGMY